MKRGILMEIDKNMTRFSNQDCVHFRDYFQALIRRKNIFLTVFFCIVLTANIFVLFVPKIYQSEAVVRIGYFVGFEMSQPVAIEFMKSDRFLKSVSESTGGKITFEKLQNMLKINQVKVLSEGVDLEKIVIRNEDPRVALEVAQAMAAQFVTLNNLKFNIKMGRLRNEIIELEKYIAKHAEKSRLVNKFYVSNDVRAKKYDQFFVAAYNSDGPNESVVNHIDMYLKAHAFEIYSKAVYPEKSIYPHRLSHFYFSLIVGFLAGIFIAVFTDYVQKSC
jgi:uncharacterized protein involved in exopolysaccharide biosynthesis